LRKQKKRKDSIYRFSDSYEFKFVEYEYKFEDYEFMFLVDYKDSLDLEPYTFNYEPYEFKYEPYEFNFEPNEFDYQNYVLNFSDPNEYKYGC